jgi:hypothetical protein
LEQVVFCGGCAGVEFYGGGGHFTFFGMGQAEGGGAGYGGMGHEALFEFADVDGVAAGLDDILHATDQADEAETTAGGEVSGAEPAIGGEQAVGVGDFGDRVC